MKSILLCLHIYIADIIKKKPSRESNQIFKNPFLKGKEEKQDQKICSQRIVGTRHQYFSIVSFKRKSFTSGKHLWQIENKMMYDVW